MKEIKGDLIKLAQEGHFDIIVHGCNCNNNMGKGIALAIKNAFPSAWYADQNTFKGDERKLGKISFALQESGLYVVNAYTQFRYWSHGDPKKVHADYEAIDRAMAEVARHAKNWFKDWPDQIRIGVPLIGAGLAGGNWNVIKPLIEKHLGVFDLTIVHFEQT